MEAPCTELALTQKPGAIKINNVPNKTPEKKILMLYLVAVLISLILFIIFIFLISKIVKMNATDSDMFVLPVTIPSKKSPTQYLLVEIDFDIPSRKKHTGHKWTKLAEENR